MCDTFRPLKLTTLSRDLDEPSLRVLVVGVPGDRLDGFVWRDGERSSLSAAARRPRRGSSPAGRAPLLTTGRARPWRRRSPRRPQRRTTSGRGPCRRSPRRLPAACRRATAANGARRREGGGRRQGGRGRARDGSPRAGRAHHPLRGRADARAPPRARASTTRRRACAARSSCATRARRVAAGGGAGGERAERARPRGRGALTVGANPVPTLAAHHAARLLVGAYGPGEPDRDALALGALLAGYAMDSTGTGCTTCSRRPLVQRGWPRTGPRTPCCSRTRCPPSPARAAAARGARGRPRQEPRGGRRAPVRAHGRDAAARPGGHGGATSTRARTPRRRAAARPHAAARGPGGDPRALRRRRATASGRAALRARTGTTIL